MLVWVTTTVQTDGFQAIELRPRGSVPVNTLPQAREPVELGAAADLELLHPATSTPCEGPGSRSGCAGAVGPGGEAALVAAVAGVRLPEGVDGRHPERRGREPRRLSCGAAPRASLGQLGAAATTRPLASSGWWRGSRASGPGAGQDLLDRGPLAGAARPGSGAPRGVLHPVVAAAAPSTPSGARRRAALSDQLRRGTAPRARRRRGTACRPPRTWPPPPATLPRGEGQGPGQIVEPVHRLPDRGARPVHEGSGAGVPGQGGPPVTLFPAECVPVRPA